MHCVIREEGEVKIKFEENGRELVWTFFVDEKDGARLEIYDPKCLGAEMWGDEYWMHSWSKI